MNAETRRRDALQAFELQKAQSPAAMLETALADALRNGDAEIVHNSGLTKESLDLLAEYANTFGHGDPRTMAYAAELARCSTMLSTVYIRLNQRVSSYIQWLEEHKERARNNVDNDQAE